MGERGGREGGYLEMEPIIKFISKRAEMGCGASSESIENVEMPGRDLFDRKELIGVGHHGRVYRCIYHLDHTEHAIKVISQLQSKSSQTIPQEAYMKMLATLKQLRHPRIAAFTHTQISETELSIVMELSKDGSLKKHIQKHGKQTEQFVSRAACQIIEGLLFLNSFEVVHKDLKPSNILLFQNESVKLCDFGLAALYDGRLLPKGMIGREDEYYRGDSVPYMAPEVITSQGMTSKGDVWSVGCVVIEMLTGKVPWSDISTTFEEVFKVMKVSAYPSLPSDLSKQCEDFLRCCLSVNLPKRATLKQLIRHPFISSYCKQNALLFQAGENKTLKPLKIDRENRVLSRNNKNSRNESREKIEEMRTPTLAEKRYADENGQMSNGACLRRIPQSSKAEKEGKYIDEHSHGVLKSIKKISPSNQYTTLSRDQILPQINEDEEQVNMVMLNNKKVKVKSPARKPYQMNLRTEPSRELLPQRKARKSIDLNQGGMNDSFEKDYQTAGQRMGTEPTQMVSQLDNKDYFKRPLKLLKKKLNEHKRKAQLQNSSNLSGNLSGSFIQSESPVVELENRYKQSRGREKEGGYHQKIRSNTESSRDEIVIDTQVARAERDRYINQQLCMNKQRMSEKSKWQLQLKKEAQVLKNQLCHRYAYPYPNIPL